MGVRRAGYHFTGSIDHVDFDEEIVGFVVDAARTDETRIFLDPLGFTGADFTVEPRRVEATDPRFGR